MFKKPVCHGEIIKCTNADPFLSSREQLVTKKSEAIIASHGQCEKRALTLRWVY